MAANKASTAKQAQGTNKRAGKGGKRAAPGKPAARRKAKAAPVKKAVPIKKAAPVRTPGKAAAGFTRPTPAKKTPGPGGRAEEPMMKALRAEHRHIGSVMQLFVDQLKAIEKGELVDTHVVYEIMDYMASWPDRYHHPREDLIYGRAAELSPTLADSLDSLQRDHDRTAKTSREVLRTIERWRDGEVSGAALVKSGRAYVDHMYEHMNSEEKLVFPQIERVLSAQDWRELAQDDELRPVADPVFGTRVQREFRHLARKLRRNVRRSVERGTMAEWVGIEAFMESLEVLSMAYEAVRSTTGEHFRTAWEDTLALYRESLLTAPLRSASNNARVGLRLLDELAGISRDALEDISRVNQERKDRMRLLDS